MAGLRMAIGRTRRLMRDVFDNDMFAAIRQSTQFSIRGTCNNTANRIIA